MREMESRGKISLRGFYSRRITRILPAATIVICTGVILAVIIPLPKAVSESLIFEGLMASFSVVNWVYYLDLPYFNFGFFQHFWSLSIEEQFYFFWPLLLIFTSVIFKLNTKKGINFILLSIIAFSLVMHFGDVVNNTPLYGYNSTFGRIWEICIGAIIAVNSDKIKLFVTHNIAKMLHLYSLIVISGSILMFDWGSAIANPFWAVPAVSGAAAIIIAGLDVTNYQKSKFWNNKLLLWIGDISYGLYLWHWLLLTSLIYYKTVTSGDLDTFNWLTLPEVLALITISIFISWLSKKYIEDPIRFSSKFKDGSYMEFSKLKRFYIPKAFMLGLAMLMATWLVLFLSYLYLTNF
jgi:peptidoglycan/LPS O-acetylase OafA/YrhL